MRNALSTWRSSCICIAALAVSCTALRASSVILDPGISPNPHPINRTGSGESFTLTPSLTDWLLGNGNRKLGGMITTSAPSGNASFGDYPNYTYTNGTSPMFATDENSTYQFINTGGTMSIFFPLQAGSGQIILWLGVSSNNSASFTADFADTPGIDFSIGFGNSVSEEFFLDYTSTVAQTLTVTLSPGTNSNVGFFAVAVSPVPEGSSIAYLALGGCGMALASLYRRRSIG